MGDGNSDGGSGGFGNGWQRLAEVASVLDLAINREAGGGVLRFGGCKRRVEIKKEASGQPKMMKIHGGGAEISHGDDSAEKHRSVVHWHTAVVLARSGSNF